MNMVAFDGNPSHESGQMYQAGWFFPGSFEDTAITTNKHEWNLQTCKLIVSPHSMCATDSTHRQSQERFLAVADQGIKSKIRYNCSKDILWYLHWWDLWTCPSLVDPGSTSRKPTWTPIGWLQVSLERYWWGIPGGRNSSLNSSLACFTRFLNSLQFSGSKHETRYCNESDKFSEPSSRATFGILRFRFTSSLHLIFRFGVIRFSWLIFTVLGSFMLTFEPYQQTSNMSLQASISLICGLWRFWMEGGWVGPGGRGWDHHDKFIATITMVYIWFIGDISIVFMGFRNQRSHHSGASTCIWVT